MTEKITLELTINELKLIDKYVHYNEETKEVFDKIKNAYPRPKMTLELGGKFEIVYYFGSVYYRLEFDRDHTWYMRKEELEGSFLKRITDGETRRLLEGIWFNDVKRGKV